MLFSISPSVTHFARFRHSKAAVRRLWKNAEKPSMDPSFQSSAACHCRLPGALIKGQDPRHLFAGLFKQEQYAAAANDQLLLSQNLSHLPRHLH